MTAPAQTLELIEIPISEIARPNHSLILADRGFMSTLAKAEAEGAGLAVIKDAVGAQAAASLQQRVTKAQALLKKQRLDLIRPYQTLIDNINEAAEEPHARLQALKESLSDAQTTFTQEQKRLADIAETKRLKDLADLEAKLAKEKQDIADKAAKIAEELRLQKEASERVIEEARKAGLPVTPIAAPVVEECWEEEPVMAQKSATELEIERVKFAPVAVVAKSSGVREVVTLFPHVRDLAKLPEMFFTRTAKIAAIQSVFCKGWRDGDAIPVLDGVEFEVQRKTVSTGAAGF